MEVHGVIVAIVLSLLFLTSLVGNTFMIVAVFLSMKLRTITNAFVVTLSVIDITKAINLIPRILHNFGYRTDTFVRSCKVVIPVILVLLMVSGIIISLIAISRYVLITKQPHTFKRVFPKRAVCAMLVASFGAPLASTLLLMYFGHLYADDQCGVHATSLYNYILGCFLFVLLIVVSVCYIKIFIFIRRHFRQVHQRNCAKRNETNTGGETVRDESAEGSEGTDDSRAGERGLVHRDKLNIESQITKNMILAVCVFVFCFFPLALHLMISNKYGTLLKYFAALTAASGSLNPLLFGWKHPVFRHVFGCMLRRSLAEIEEPSAWLRERLRQP